MRILLPLVATADDSTTRNQPLNSQRNNTLQNAPGGHHALPRDPTSANSSPRNILIRQPLTPRVGTIAKSKHTPSSRNWGPHTPNHMQDQTLSKRIANRLTSPPPRSILARGLAPRNQHEAISQRCLRETYERALASGKLRPHMPKLRKKQTRRTKVPQIATGHSTNTVPQKQTRRGTYGATSKPSQITIEHSRRGPTASQVKTATQHKSRTAEVPQLAVGR